MSTVSRVTSLPCHRITRRTVVQPRLIPAGRWVPVDEWIQAAEHAQRAGYATTTETLAEVLGDDEHRRGSARVFPPIAVMNR